MTPSTSKEEVPPLPPRPNEQPQLVARRFSPYGAMSPYGHPSPYFGMGASHLGSPFGVVPVPGVDATFQSIQSIVQAISSISMMLESTYMAVNSSFRAVMDVADHFINLKNNISSVFSAVSLLRTIKWFFQRILYMFNLVGEEQIWSQSLTDAKDKLQEGQQSILQNRQSSWPMLMFLGVAVGAPYVMYQFQKPPTTSDKWMRQEDCHYIAEALYDFKTDRQTEIPLKVGQKVIIAPKEQQPKISDWLLATTDGKKSGLIPLNYVKIIKFEIVE